jgi:TatD DNase family protein
MFRGECPIVGFMDECGYFDSHAHFEGSDTARLLVRARAAGVTHVMAVGGNPVLNAGVRRAVGLAADRSSESSQMPSLGAALGLDRSCAGMPGDEMARFEAEVADTVRDDAFPLRAVGEIGLDYYHDGAGRAEQRRLFARMLALAAEHALPAIVHTREAEEDTLSLLREHIMGGAGGLAAEGRPGVIHCFTGTAAMAEACVELGFFVSFSGIVTFRNADALRDVARRVPDDRLLIETDSPYLAPVPLRGRPNEPAFVVHTAACLARERRTDPSGIAAITRRNAQRLFGMA